MEIGKLGVVGAGQMGGGIAQVAAQAGYQVLLNDVSAEFVRRGLAAVAGNLERAVGRGRLKPEERDAILGRIEPAPELESLAGAQFVVEAVPENEELKLATFKKLDRICPPQTILASNTSSISITRMAAHTSRPARMIGMHFMHPVPVMRLVEIIRGLATAPETYQATRELAERCGKITVTAEDFPGFIVNRILVPMINEAVYALYEGTGSIADIDTAMKLGTNQPMGPLELADMIGLDTCVAIMEVMQRGTGDDKYRTCPLLKKYVDAGYLGRKSGRGFYRYDEAGRAVSA